MSKRDPKIRLLHMRDYAQKAVFMVKGKSRNNFNKDEKLQLAVTRLVELIGEAASQVPTEFRRKYQEIPWKQIIGTRHRLIHGYDFVDYDILWDTVNRNLPELIDELNHILEKD